MKLGRFKQQNDSLKNLIKMEMENRLILRFGVFFPPQKCDMNRFLKCCLFRRNEPMAFGFALPVSRAS